MQVTHVKRRREINTYAVLYSSAYNSLKQAQDSELGRFYNCMSVSLYCALALEAYFNHIGLRQFEIWKLNEPKLGPTDKLDAICKHTGYRPDLGRRPWQTFKQLTSFRNDMAHGKSVVLADDQRLLTPPKDDPVKPPMPDWEKLCSLEAAERVFIDTRLMLEQLHPLAGREDDLLWDHGLFEWEVSPSEAIPANSPD